MKVALYSGNIPSTTFIENLIDGLSQSGIEILLFGKQTADVGYKGKVKIFPLPSKGVTLLFHFIKQSVILFYKNPNLFLEVSEYLEIKKKKSERSFKKQVLYFQ